MLNNKNKNKNNMCMKRQKYSPHKNKPHHDGQPDNGRIKRQSTLLNALRQQTNRLDIVYNTCDMNKKKN